jgi:hypothetical protein
LGGGFDGSRDGERDADVRAWHAVGLSGGCGDAVEGADIDSAQGDEGGSGKIEDAVLAEVDGVRSSASR